MGRRIKRMHDYVRLRTREQQHVTIIISGQLCFSGVSFAAQNISSSSNEVKDSSKALLDRATELNEIVGRFKV